MWMIMTWYSEVHALVQEFLPVSVFRAWVWRTLYADGLCPYHIQRVQHLEPADMCSRLDLCRWINSNPHVIRNVLFTDDAHFTRDGVNNTIWGRDNPHETIESNYQHRFSVNVWCGVIDVIGPYIFQQRLTGAIYANSLRWTASTLRECSSTNTTTDVLSAWWSAASFQPGREAVSGS